ncbi:FFLEELY motif protein [Pseudomarimonas arenosa]|uniref:DUF8198 domain-containing protein n=1 Tax=Pseudomarimonas arenosa TaxID=2774145 RepID=A0AAW3ZFA2_9GAMM|nr:hypothetical protein [Pseudomarimonas arenosa]MBD8524573.1 hypothetical protein [Pseudomarimonas arenosa]
MTSRLIDARLLRLLAWNNRARDPESEPANKLAVLPELQRWQAKRLRASFTDFLADPRRCQAAEFFLTDLYGDFDVSRRDRDVERVLPLMRRVLPERLLESAADAIELSVLSHRLDLRMAKALTSLGARKVCDTSYTEAYRHAGLRRLREHQISLIVGLGHNLEQAVSKPLIGHLLRLARTPAKAAGLSELQSFLERGFAAFRALGSARDFVEDIAHRERSVSERLFSGHPRPFEVVPKPPSKTLLR